jgi:hypothetical protein
VQSKNGFVSSIKNKKEGAVSVSSFMRDDRLQASPSQGGSFMRVCSRFFAVALVLIVIGFLLGISFPAIGAEQGKATDNPPIIIFKVPVKSTPAEPSAVKPTPVEPSAAKPASVKPSAAKPTAVKTTPAKLSAVNCKYTTKIDKPGQVVYVPTGGECEQLLKDFTLQSKSCCVCAKENADLVCKGACCPVMLNKADIKR